MLQTTLLINLSQLEILFLVDHWEDLPMFHLYLSKMLFGGKASNKNGTTKTN